MLDIVEQRERLDRARAMFARIHAFITKDRRLGELKHFVSASADLKEYCERYDAETRGWVSLWWRLESVITKADGSTFYEIEVVLAVENIQEEGGARADEDWEGATLGVRWTEVDGWYAEHFDHENESSLAEIVDETPSGPLVSEAEALLLIGRIANHYLKMRSVTPDRPSAQA